MTTMTSEPLTLAGLMGTVRLFRSEQEIMVPRSVTSYSTLELWQLCLENTCNACGFVWPYRKVTRTESGVVMIRPELFAGPREFKGIVDGQCR